MTTQLNVCNVALMRIGVSIPIADLTEGSNEARVLNTVYLPTLDRVLAEAPWPFATRYISLQDIGTPPEGWTYRYRYPTDCVALRRLVVSVTDFASKYPFQVVEDVASNALAVCTDLEAPLAEYTARITAANLFPVAFANALSWALAAEIAIPLSANAGLGKQAGDQYQAALNMAYASAMNEQVEVAVPEDTWVSVRR
jgi:hypothetical protein